ncbi:MAG: cysteine--tRNA ligase [SAR324 cluster bacterium]|uniref:Cysteine--tRNA ligase n=1 Tax=SAR324 cluster bacterium TaxID=2024889 RepID=A0A7X9FSI0_9DELT|nr:cysteine--tRNA ligase [SAR324 cluster bacterium]
MRKFKHKLQIYSSFSRTKEEFKSIRPGEVRMYACGITVYDEAHLGHARQAIVFDVIRNYLEYCGYKVNYVRNFTDIDDKIIKRAAEKNINPMELSSFYIKETTRDLLALKVPSATAEPKVTDHIPQIVEFIHGLIQKNHAYVHSGDVLFDVTSLASYGALSHRQLADCINADESSGKRNPQDFALWKKAKEGEPSWESPWGPGRPGWHIECSVMARVYLGDELDIHGGGIDLLFPHHENERAQSEALTGKTFARYWVHNGLVNVNGQKMSKSLGNFLTIKDALALYPADVIRYAVLSLTYSAPMDFSDELLRTATKRVHYCYRTVLRIKECMTSQEELNIKSKKGEECARNFMSAFLSAMDDDFNTAASIAALSNLLSEANEILDSKQDNASKIAFVREIWICINEFAKVFHMLDEEPSCFLENLRIRVLKIKGISKEEVERLIAERQAAKARRDFAKADAIRNELKEFGITLQDRPGGIVHWDVVFD